MGLTFNPAIKSRRMGMCHKKKIPKNIYESDGFVVEWGVGSCGGKCWVALVSERTG